MLLKKSVAINAGYPAPFRKLLMQKSGKIVVASQHYPPRSKHDCGYHVGDR
jgi:hypothetical protein